ncbi:MAG TPA: DUF6351 family protein [Solirubrobacteraceae bacterium]|nr:DUF6351 family protein [Solirubrobacteraceae bacterium]
MGTLLAMLCVPTAVLAANVHTAAVRWPAVTLRTLSGRADLVSGGSSLIQIKLSRPAKLKRLKVTLGHQNVSADFARRRDGQIEGLVSGLRLGRNTLKAVFPDGSGAKLTLVNHPNGGPLFSGPQLQPWKCQVGAVDAQCDQAPTYTYEYWSKDKNAFEAYDPANPPSDVANTTTASGVTLPFIIRIDRLPGPQPVQDRDALSAGQAVVLD